MVATTVFVCILLLEGLVIGLGVLKEASAISNEWWHDLEGIKYIAAGAAAIIVTLVIGGNLVQYWLAK